MKHRRKAAGIVPLAASSAVLSSRKLDTRYRMSGLCHIKNGRLPLREQRLTASGREPEAGGRLRSARRRMSRKRV